MLDELKLILGIESNDMGADELIELIVSKTTQRLKNKLNVDTVPTDLEYIVFEIAVKRFNRIGSEGMTAQTIEGKSETFAESDFDEFKDDIQTWLDRQKDEKRGKVRFI